MTSTWLTQMLSVSLLALTLSHCSGNVEVDVANLAATLETEQLNQAIGKVDLTKLCSTATVTAADGRRLKVSSIATLSRCRAARWK